MSERHIDDIFRQALENHEVSPPFKNWDNIQQHLPVPAPLYRKPAFKAGIAAALVLAVALSVVTTRHYLAPEQVTTAQEPPPANNNTLDNPGNQQAAEELSGEIVSQKNQTTNLPASTINLSTNQLSENNFTLQRSNHLNKTAPKYGVKANSHSPANLTHSAVKNNTTILQQSPSLPTAAVSSVVSEDLTKINPTNGTEMPSNALKSGTFAVENNITPAQTTVPQTIPQAELNSITQTVLPEHNVLNAVSVIGKPKKNKTNGLYFGSFYSVHNSWLLNNQALEATKNIDDINYRFRIGKSYGFSAGFDISSNWGLQTEWAIKSVQGQSLSYKPMESVTNQNTEINLTYTYVPVLVKYKFNRTAKLTGQPTVLNYIAGVQYGTLKSAEINLNNPILQENLLKKSLWGLVAGVDYDMYLTPNYFVSLGARASFSTSSNKFTQISFPGNSTANQLVWGLRIGLNYRFVK